MNEEITEKPVVEIASGDGGAEQPYSACSGDLARLAKSTALSSTRYASFCH